MHRLSAVIFLCFTFGSSCLSQARPHKTLQSAVVVGAVYCDVGCLDSPKSLPGASVAVECKNSSSIPHFRQVVKTNKHGEFDVPFPFPIGKDDKAIRECSVRLINSNQPSCSVPATASSSLHHKARIHGAGIFSPGLLILRPAGAGHHQTCDKKQSINNFKNNAHNELPPISNPSNENAQLVGDKVNQPILPSQVPPNSFYPPIVFPPNPFQPPPSSYSPPHPNFQPPPSTFPPATPGFNFPPTPGFNFPPTPGLIPPPSPTPRPGFPFPFPPFGFQPAPGFPGTPPAEVSSSSP